MKSNYNRRSPSLSELTPIIFKMELTHLRLEASNLIVWLQLFLSKIVKKLKVILHTLNFVIKVR